MADISFDDLIPKTGAANAAPQGLTFDDLIPPAPLEGDGAALNATAGLNNAIYSTLGAPVDLARGAINLGIRGVNAAAGTEVTPVPSSSFGGAESISGMFGSIGVPEPKDIQAVTTAERIARGTGEGVGYAIAPEAAIGALTRTGALTGRLADAAGRLFGTGASVGGVTANAVSGGAAGAGASSAMEAAPDPWKPAAGLAGGMGGGFAGALAASSPQIARAAGQTVSDYAAPLTTAGRERLAADQLAKAATDAFAVKSALQNVPSELVSGSMPTTFQVTGDMGLGGLERGAQTRRPELFNQRRADQNSARTTALEGIQPTGAPEKVAESARAYVQGIQSRSDAIYEAAATQARKSTEALGRGSAPGIAGDNIRASLEQARNAAKEAERGLWSAVDPDGTLALPAANARRQVAETFKSLPKSAKPPQGEEAAIYGAVGQYNDVMPFGEITALQSRVKSEMRAERLANGESPAYRRLTQLNSALHSDIEDAVSGKMVQQAEAVARGEMSFEETLHAAMMRKQQEWYGERQAVAGDTGSGPRPVQHGRGGSQAVSGLSGAGGQEAGRFGPASGNPGLQGASELQPNFNAEAAGRLTAAQAATRSRVETFDNKTLGPMRRRPSTVSPYDMPAASIPARVFNSKPESAEAIAKLRSAVGDDAALSQLQDYAVDRIRRHALKDDGTLDPAKLETWRRAHAHALKALPELDSRIGSAAAASRTLAETGLQQRAAIDSTQRGRLGALMNLSDPTDVTRVVGSIFQRQDRMKEMGKLASVVGRDPEAKEGLRKAIVDHIQSRLVSNTEAGTSGQGAIKSDQFQSFIRENANTLRVAGFSEPEVKTMQAIADDLQRANRSVTAVKLPGQSNTAQDWQKVREGDAPATILGRVIMGAAATGGFASSGATGGIVGIVGAKAAAAMRDFGLETVNDIVADALLHPDRARILLQKATPSNQRAVSEIIARNYRKAAMSSAVVSSGDQDASK